MKIKDYKCKCGHDDFFFADKGNQKGIYCSYCGKWLKWADKDEQNLRMKQESILDKIRAKIKALCPEPTVEDVVDGNLTKDAIWETLAEVLQIIDKYKAESEEDE